jgi:hypothetical protein
MWSALPPMRPAPGETTDPEGDPPRRLRLDGCFSSMPGQPARVQPTAWTGLCTVALGVRCPQRDACRRCRPGAAGQHGGRGPDSSARRHPPSSRLTRTTRTPSSARLATALSPHCHLMPPHCQLAIRSAPTQSAPSRRRPRGQTLRTAMILNAINRTTASGPRRHRPGLEGHRAGAGGTDGGHRARGQQSGAVWMAHCHIAEHAESGMMFSFTVTCTPEPVR